LLAWPLLLAMACGGQKPAGDSGAASTEPSEVREARGLLGAGRYDEVLARLKTSTAPEAYYLQAEAWAKKSETAPLPTPEALPPGSPRDAVPVTPEFKPEELQAMALYEKAAAGMRQEPGPRLGLARLLTPHAQRRYDAEQAAAAAPKGKPSVVPSGPDFSPARVAGEYRAAAEASPKNAEAIEALYAFAVRVGQIDQADWALQTLMRRESENPDQALRYGDFLRDVKKDPMSAVSVYRQVLIWRSDDAAVKARIADIYIDAGIAHHAKGEYASADARYQDAQKWITDRSSDQYKRLQHEIERLRRLRR
jgi:tetratricopeptide (TPR) repeat protein